LKIKSVLCRAGVMDNYAYIITDEAAGITAVVDASEAEPIKTACQMLNLRPSYILTTHHHFDHVGGNAELKAEYGLKIVGPEAEKSLIPELDIAVKDGDKFALGQSKAQVISAAGHTLGHILWYFPADKVLFTGDVLFNLCIGGIFEGTPEQMWNSLQKIKALPDDVVFYAGHEYTAGALRAAITRGQTPAMEKYLGLAYSRLTQKTPDTPITLGLEKQCNPYLMINDKTEFMQIFK
jgi:hydroxyacylglutathione hydrolase